MTAAPAAETPQHLDLATYLPHLNTTFEIRGGDAPVPLELVEGADRTRPEPRDRHTAFSLVFRGPSETPLDQRMYELHHPELGDLPLFLVPIGPDGTGLLYEALVNRLTPQGGPDV